MQKSFAVYLLAFTVICIASCKMNPDTQTPGVKALQGEWQQDSVPMQKNLITYSLYHFRFSCDSFFVAIKTFSKVNYGNDTCMNSGHWTEYTRGVYAVQNDTLYMKGQFCNPDYTIKDNTGCFRSGNYAEVFKIGKQTDSLIQMVSTSGVIPLQARLIKRNTCTIKPL